MSVPPQGGWPPHQPGSTPQGQPPFNQPGYNPQQPPPPGWQSGPWPQQPAPKGTGVKWLLIAVAVLLVIGISVGATLLFTRDGGGGSTTTSTSGAPSDIASANDTGPVSVITEEPTCSAMTAVNNSLASAQANGWADNRNSLGPISQWTTDERSTVDVVAKAMTDAANRAVPLAKQTPHRVIRELYEQFIAYSRAYVESIPNYSQSDNALATASVASSSAIVGVCNAIESGSTSRSLSLTPASAPSSVAPVGDSSNPSQFLESSNAKCGTWIDRLNTFNAATSPEWQNRDSGIPASQWTPERRAIEEAAQPLLAAYASDIQELGRDSDNGQYEDFAYTASIYIRAYLTAGTTFTSSDGWLNYTAFQIANFVSAACASTSK